MKNLVDFLMGWNLARDPIVARRRRLALLAGLSFLAGLALLFYMVQAAH